MKRPAILLDELFDAIRSRIADEYERGYAEGFSAGGAAMRDTIFRAAQVPVPENIPATAHQPQKHIEPMRVRAPRGSVGKAIDPILRENPGMLVPDLEAAVKHSHPDIHPKSIGNELRRFEGEKYKRDREGGYRWFLVDDQDGGRTGAGAPAADTQHEPERR